jgi:hypothetical protein
LQSTSLRARQKNYGTKWQKSFGAKKKKETTRACPASKEETPPAGLVLFLHDERAEPKRREGNEVTGQFELD